MTTISSPTYREFLWTSQAPPNGRHGAALTERVVDLTSGLSNIQSICDLGCGNGFTAGRLARSGYEVTGVDASVSGIDLARRTYPEVKFVNALIDHTLSQQLEPGSFDLVVSCDVIEHLYCPSDLVACAFKLLKTGGHFLLMTPYHGYWKNLALAVSGKMDAHFEVFNEGGHIKFFSTRTLGVLLERQSFSDLKFSFYGRLPLLWMNMICLSTKNGS